MAAAAQGALHEAAADYNAVDPELETEDEDMATDHDDVEEEVEAEDERLPAAFGAVLQAMPALRRRHVNKHYTLGDCCKRGPVGWSCTPALDFALRHELWV